ncbi:MAG: PQQ-binding-like beta-propeller repeat protein [Vicinamibacterales bacterium]
MARNSIGLACAITLVICARPSAQNVDGGRKAFVTRCASCHGTDGNGGELGPAIAARAILRTDDELRTVLRAGFPAAGMPPFSTLSDAEAADLVAFVRTLKPRTSTVPLRSPFTLSDGRVLDGLVLNRTHADVQVLDATQRLQLLRPDGNRYRAVTSQADWPSYNGGPDGSRYSPLAQIDRSTVERLAPKWMFTLPNTSRPQVTPVVVGGVMYVTSANECWAIDAGSGREIWRYQRPRTKGLIGNAAGGVNRGVGVAGDRLFMVTDHAHVIALDRHTGALLWDTEMADWRQNYNATGAPLPVGNLVITGTSGGDEGVRGFVGAYDQATGKEVWRFWTVPAPGERGSETWQGKGIAHPGGSTWMTGAYDPQLDTVYWNVGNPGPDLIGDDRLGDNLYTDSVVALDAKTGALKWHFQFTPHDVWDYDAQEPTALVDTTWQGKPRKLLVQANRNGFLYVLDRTTGEFLSGVGFIKNITWASGLDPRGRPIRVPGMEPSPEGKRVCPSLDGATNWYSSSFNPLTSLYYVQTNDKCGIFTRTDQEWAAGRGFMGGSFRQAPNEPAQRLLRAIDIRTGKVAWEVPQTGNVNSWGGVLSTAGRVVFFGDDSGAFAAVDADNGRRLWSFQTSQLWKASPMTYVFDNQQYVAVASGSTIIAFGLR